MKIENVADLEQHLERLAKLVDRLVGICEEQELKQQLQQRLIDQMQGVLIDAGLAERRPKEDPGLAN